MPFLRPASSFIPVVVGPTASGKTSLSLRLAQQLNGEIICADSRTVYREMDIGTAKPDRKQQKLLWHHCLDLVNPDENYSAQQFKTDAKRSIQDIQKRRKIPVVVGGSGLYVNALIYDYNFPKGVSAEQRNELQKLPLGVLVERLRMVDPEAAERVDLANPRRVVRAIETAGERPKMTIKSVDSYLLIGLNPGIEQLSTNIAQRTKKMIEDGLIDETQKIAEKYGENIEPLNTVGYREALKYLRSELSLAQMEEQINIKTRQLAKRQMTWFKRDNNIRWFDDAESAMRVVGSIPHSR
jgi:tRNA dimethylallyltransferase